LHDSLDPALWTDQTHLQPKKGEKAFDEEQEAVEKLRELIKEQRV